MPLASLVSVGARSHLGGCRGLSSDLAQVGRGTGLVGEEVSFSVPPKPLAATGSPEGCGFRVATIACVLIRYCLAARFTSASVTFCTASTSSWGELRPSPATASDHTSAKPGMELRANSLEARTARLEAATRS